MRALVRRVARARLAVSCRRGGSRGGGAFNVASSGEAARLSTGCCVANFCRFQVDRSPPRQQFRSSSSSTSRFELVAACSRAALQLLFFDGRLLVVSRRLVEQRSVLSSVFLKTCKTRRHYARRRLLSRDARFSHRRLKQSEITTHARARARQVPSIAARVRRCCRRRRRCEPPATTRVARYRRPSLRRSRQRPPNAKPDSGERRVDGR